MTCTDGIFGKDNDKGLCRNAQYEPCSVVESCPNPQPIREIKLGTHTPLHQHKRQSGVENRVDTKMYGRAGLPLLRKRVLLL
jgi:hypothetical protein